MIWRKIKRFTSPIAEVWNVALPPAVKKMHPRARYVGFARVGGQWVLSFEEAKP